MFTSRAAIRLLTVQTILISLALGAATMPLHAAEGSGTEFDLGDCPQQSSETNYTIEAEIESSQKVFEHPSFTIKGIVKANVNYYDSANACAGKTKYEDLWYAYGKPLGIEKCSSLTVPADTRVAIRIKQMESGSLEEGKASANIILRVALDIMLNHARVSKVSVPSAAFNNIIAQIQKYRAKLVPPGMEPPREAKVTFPIESESTGMKQVVYFL